MNQDKFDLMLKDGRDIISILQSVPEDGRALLSAIFGAYLDGWMARERLAEAERPST